MATKPELAAKQALVFDEAEIRGIENVHRITACFKNQFKLDIIHRLQKHPDITVTDLYVGLRMDQSVVSAHLAGLRAYGLVTRRREGKEKYYSVNAEVLNRFSIRLAAFQDAKVDNPAAYTSEKTVNGKYIYDAR